MCLMALIALKTNVLNARFIHSGPWHYGWQDRTLCWDKMAQMSLQVERRRMKEKYYSSVIKFQLKSIFIEKNYIIWGSQPLPFNPRKAVLSDPVSKTNNMGGRDASEKCCCCLVAKSCLTFLQPHGLWPMRVLCLGKNTRVGCCILLQGIFPTQGLNPQLLHCRQILYYWVIREVPNGR